MWMAVLGAMTATGFAPAPAVDGGFSPADGARRRLARVCASLDGSRDLVIALAEGKAPAVALHVLDHHVTEQDEADLVRLRAGLDKISEQRRRIGDWRRPGAVTASASAALPADAENASHRITRSVLHNWRPSPSSRRRAPWCVETIFRSLRGSNIKPAVAQPMAEIVAGLRGRPALQPLGHRV
jgi:hypothetical protein